MEIKRKMDKMALLQELQSEEDLEECSLSNDSSMIKKNKLHRQDNSCFSFSSQKAQQYYLHIRIYATSEMSSINYIMQRPSRDFAVFDADENLIVPLDVFYEKHVHLNSLLSQRLSIINKTRRALFFHCLFTKLYPWKLIEPYTPRLIADLQTSGMYAMVLTALNSIIVPEINLHTANWRSKHFKELGFNFSRGFNIDFLYGFSKEHSSNLFEPYFKRGVMLCGNIPKGEALVSFFRAVNYKPKSVLFVDDSFCNVYSVYKSLSQEGIECHCVLYTRKHQSAFKELFTIQLFEQSVSRVEEAVNLFIELDEAYEQKIKHDRVLSGNTDSTSNPSLPSSKKLTVTTTDSKVGCESTKLSFREMLDAVNKKLYKDGGAAVLEYMFGNKDNKFFPGFLSLTQSISSVTFSNIQNSSIGEQEGSSYRMT